jgi:hypothetical protein
MKKTIALAAMLFTAVIVFAQETEQDAELLAKFGLTQADVTRVENLHKKLDQ